MEHDTPQKEELTNKQLALKILQEKNTFVYEGGGVLGLGHLGAMVRLYELGGMDSIETVVGSSVGSIISLSLACGATNYYIKQKVMEMDLKKFQDGGNWICRLIRLIVRFGIHKGKELDNFIGTILEELTQNRDITFKQAYDRFGRDLTITYLSTRYKKTIYANHLTTPDLKIRTAAVWSSSIPLFFKAGRKYRITKNKIRQLQDILSDGGVADNYPLHVARKKTKPRYILGFKLYNSKLEDTDELVSDEDYGLTTNVKDHVLRLVEILRDQALRYHVDEEDWKLTCRTDVAQYKTTDFEITKEDKEWLYNSGRRAMDKHLQQIEKMLDKGNYPLY